MKKKKYRIVVRSFLNQDYHHEVGSSMSEAKALKVEKGLLMTMDMDRYYVETIAVKEEEDEKRVPR